MMALRTKVNLKSFRGVMASKVFGLPLPLVAGSAGVLAVIYLRRRKAAEQAAGGGTSDASATTAGTGSYGAGAGGDAGGGASFGGGGFDVGGGFFAPVPIVTSAGTPPGQGSAALAGRIAGTRTRLRLSNRQQRKLAAQMRVATSTRRRQTLRARQRTVAGRQVRQTARIARLKTRRRMLAGKTSTTGA